ncbi:MAG: methylphosphotriester-DNA--protein-cysteine methyltransferase [Salibacteraceae bacterium]|jgi:methylphosphotriester-DNA--protein-cysteine methyltransferase
MMLLLEQMIEHEHISDFLLKRGIKNGRIQYGGNKKLKIYGKLDCSSGKRMKKMNRVFFSTIDDAIQNGFRPCGHCFRADYKIWKNGTVR